MDFKIVPGTVREYHGELLFNAVLDSDTNPMPQFPLGFSIGEVKRTAASVQTLEHKAAENTTFSFNQHYVVGDGDSIDACMVGNVRSYPPRAHPKTSTPKPVIFA